MSTSIYRDNVIYTGASTFSSSTTISGTLTAAGINASGYISAVAAGLSSTLGVSGAATLAAVNASGLISGVAATFTSTLGVSGTATLAAINASGYTSGVAAGFSSTLVVIGNVGIGATDPLALTEIQGGLTTVGAVLTLSSKETTTVANDILGRINFRAALDAAGTDAILTGASIAAVAENTFSASVNETGLQFSTGASEAAVERMRIDHHGNVGIGTTTPGYKLSVAGTNGLSLVVQNTDATANQIAGFFNSIDSTGEFAYIDVGRSAGNNNAAIFGYLYDTTVGNESAFMSVYGDNPAAGTGLFVKKGGNVGIGTTTPGGSSTAGTKVLSLGDGTAPVGGVANQVSLYSADVSSSAELFAMDEAGNTPQLTPHPTDFLDTLPLTGREYPWAYSSSNQYLGKKIQVDMMGVIREIERLSGKKFIVLSDLSPEMCADWDAGQNAQWKLCDQEITSTQDRIADLNSKIEQEFDLEKKLALKTELNSIVVPKPYEKKSPPKWMKDRGVQSLIR